MILAGWLFFRVLVLVGGGVNGGGGGHRFAWCKQAWAASG